jgi:ABC-type multidrug transport system fused ATPase/permease subunit
LLIFSFSSVLSSFVTLTFVALSAASIVGGVILTPEKVFTTLSFCLMMRLTLFKFFVFSVQFVAEARIACKRIGELLLVVDSGERGDRGTAAVAVAESAAALAAESTAGDPAADTAEAPVFALRDASFSWLADATVARDATRAVLRGVTFSAQPGDLVCIVGYVFFYLPLHLRGSCSQFDSLPRPSLTISPGRPVGSGKTSLLMALAGEIDALRGGAESGAESGGGAKGSAGGSAEGGGSAVDIPSARAADDARPAVRAAYVGQQPWVLSDTIKANITIGRRFNAPLYAATLDACLLRDDLAQVSLHFFCLLGDSCFLYSSILWFAPSFTIRAARGWRPHARRRTGGDALGRAARARRARARVLRRDAAGARRR